MNTSSDLENELAGAISRSFNGDGFASTVPPKTPAMTSLDEVDRFLGQIQSLIEKTRQRLLLAEQGHMQERSKVMQAAVDRVAELDRAHVEKIRMLKRMLDRLEAARDG